MSGNEIASYF